MPCIRVLIVMPTFHNSLLMPSFQPPTHALVSDRIFPKKTRRTFPFYRYRAWHKTEVNTTATVVNLHLETATFVIRHPLSPPSITTHVFSRPKPSKLYWIATAMHYHCRLGHGEDIHFLDALLFLQVTFKWRSHPLISLRNKMWNCRKDIQSSKCSN